LTNPTYSISVGNPVLEINQWQSAAFVQTDWRASTNLTLSLGGRYEWQSNLDDNNNFDPRLGFAYQLGSNTVIRGGTGTFHQRMQFFLVTDLLRNDGNNQQLFEISEAPFVDNPLQSGTDEDFLIPSTIRLRAPELTAPYTWNNELSVETSFPGGLIVTGSYRFIRGLHVFRDRNLNAPLDFLSSVPRSCQIGQDPATCLRPDPTKGNVNQVESTGTSTSHTLRIGVRQRLSFLNLNASYDFDSTYDDRAGGGGRGGGGGGGGNGGNNINLPADNYDMDSEWGRSGARHRMNVSANLRLPWDISANTIFNWNTGSPYTHQTGVDDNQDTTRNDRPPGVPKNSLTGPGFFETGFDLSKAIQLRSDQVEVGPTGAAGQGPVGAGGYYGQRTGIRMTIRAQVTNLLNNVNFQSFSGVETSSFFQLPTRARNPRQIVLSVRFDI
jgi:outer membrane receptor protein involved in Fe transport